MHFDDWWFYAKKTDFYDGFMLKFIHGKKVHYTDVVENKSASENLYHCDYKQKQIFVIRMAECLARQNSQISYRYDIN
jgi:hypothetical protein